MQMTNESVLKDADGIYDEFATPEKAAESVKLKVRSPVLALRRLV